MLELPGGPVAKIPCSQSMGGVGSILGQGTRSHMLKLGVHNLQLEIPKQTKIFLKSLRKMKMLLK